jgi:Spy/CpxP family protein refolding chaperone
MKKTICLVLFVVFFAVAVSVAIADPGQPPPGMAPSGPPDDMGFMSPGQPSIMNFVIELNLTSGQYEKLKAIEKVSRENMKKCMEELRFNMDAMRDELEKNMPDEKKLDVIIEKIAEDHRMVLKYMVRDMLSIKAVLTPEQQKILKKLMEEKKKMMMKNRPDMWPPGPHPEK